MQEWRRKEMRKISMLVLLVLTIAAIGNFSMMNAQGLGIKIAVTPEEYDHMQLLLDEWGYTYTEISASDLADHSVTKQYDAIFINCAYYDETDADNAANNLKDFVDKGGAIYASDWADVFINSAFPTYVTFGEKDGPVQTADAKVKDAGLVDYLGGEDTLSFYYDLPGWVPIESVSSNVDILAVADVTYGGSSHPHMPAVVRFNYGMGSVIYTTFHEAAQGGLVKKMMQYLMLTPLTSEFAYEIKQDLTEGGYGIEKDNRGELDQDETVQYTISLNVQKDLIFELNFGGSELELSVYKPDGELYDQQSSANPPVSVVVDDAEKGEWKYKVKGVDVPSEHYPYALMVGSKGGPGAAGEGIPIWVLALIGVIIAAVIIGVVAAVVLRKRRPPATPQYPPQYPYYQQPPYQPSAPPEQIPPQAPPPGSPPPQPPPPPP